MSRLSIEISAKQHQHIKTLAAVKGQSMKEFVMERLLPDESDEEQSWQELKHLLSSRIKAAEDGAISTKSISQVADEKLNRLDR